MDKGAGEIKKEEGNNRGREEKEERDRKMG